MKITWYGTAAISIESGEEGIVFDPYVPEPNSQIKGSVDNFLKFKNIFVTHGHFDHIRSIPEIAAKNGAHVYCGQVPHSTLLAKGVNDEDMYPIQPNTVTKLGPFTVIAYRSLHTVFDRELVRKTVFGKRMKADKKVGRQLLKDLILYPENKETFGYLIQVEGKRIFILGSLAIAPRVRYPQNCDLLVLPYQGQTHMVEPALEIVKELQPKCVMLDHFDDTFPPVSDTIDTSDIVAALDGICPVIVPEHFESIEL